MAAPIQATSACAPVERRFLCAQCIRQNFNAGTRFRTLNGLEVHIKRFHGSGCNFGRQLTLSDACRNPSAPAASHNASSQLFLRIVNKKTVLESENILLCSVALSCGKLAHDSALFSDVSVPWVCPTANTSPGAARVGQDKRKLTLSLLRVKGDRWLCQPSWLAAKVGRNGQLRSNRQLEKCRCRLCDNLVVRRFDEHVYRWHIGHLPFECSKCQFKSVHADEASRHEHSLMHPVFDQSRVLDRSQLLERFSAECFRGGAGISTSVAGTSASLDDTRTRVAGTSACVAGTSASLAGTSASLAGTRTRVAGTSACVAGTSASLAGTSATVAGTSACVAGTSASLAGTSASLDDTRTRVAGTSACVAGTSASLAGTSASLDDTRTRVAGTSACVAGTSASLAGTSATVAGTSATVAGTSASLAGTSASLAGTSASLAGTSASLAGQTDSLEDIVKQVDDLITAGRTALLSSRKLGVHVSSKHVVWIVDAPKPTPIPKCKAKRKAAEPATQPDTRRRGRPRKSVEVELLPKPAGKKRKERAKKDLNEVEARILNHLLHKKPMAPLTSHFQHKKPTTPPPRRVLWNNYGRFFWTIPKDAKRNP